MEIQGNRSDNRLVAADRPAGETRVGAIQSSFAGHRLMFIRRLAESTQGGEFRLFTTREGYASTEFRLHLADLESTGKLNVELAGRAADGDNELVESAVRRAAELNIAHLLVPDADALLLSLCRAAIRRRGRRLPILTVLVLRTSSGAGGAHRHRLASFAKRRLLAILPRIWRGTRTFFLTDAFGIVSRRPGYNSLSPVPNPAPDFLGGDPEKVRRQLGLTPNTFLIGLVGMLNRYKRPELVLGALNGLPTTARLLAAGPADSYTREVLDEAMARLGGHRILRIDRYVDESELGSYIAACNAIILTYEGDDPSATLITAVKAGVPVVAAGSPWLKEIVTGLQLGVVAELSIGSVTAGLLEIVATPHKYRDSIRVAQDRIVPEAFERTLLGSTK